MKQASHTQGSKLWPFRTGQNAFIVAAHPGRPLGILPQDELHGAGWVFEDLGEEEAVEDVEAASAVRFLDQYLHVPDHTSTRTYQGAHT